MKKIIVGALLFQALIYMIEPTLMCKDFNVMNKKIWFSTLFLDILIIIRILAMKITKVDKIFYVTAIFTIVIWLPALLFATSKFLNS